MNLYSIKPHDDETGTLHYVVAKTYGHAVRKYKTRRKVVSDLNFNDWKDVPDPSKVVLVCGPSLLIAGRD